MADATEVLARIDEAARAYLAARGSAKVQAAHELRKAANRLYAVEKQAAATPEPQPEPPTPKRSRAKKPGAQQQEAGARPRRQAEAKKSA